MGLGREQAVEIFAAPLFNPGEKVRSIKHVKNDGTYPGKEIGENLVRKGDVGYVRDIGIFLQQFYIYAVEFVDRAAVVGMRGRELASIDNPPHQDRAADRRAGACAMKLMIRRTEKGLSAYAPKKDLEVPIVAVEKETLWGGWVRLKNGWVLALPVMPAETRLPITVEAQRIGE